MNYFRHQTRLASALVVLLVAQFLVPQFLGSGAMAQGLNDRGAGGIIICTATGLMELNRSGELVPAGSSDDQSSGQTECFVCLISGQLENSDVLLSPNSFNFEANTDGQACKPGGQNVLAGAVNRTTSARAPPA